VALFELDIAKVKECHYCDTELCERSLH